MAVHQLVVGAAPGDAITEIALNTRALLRRCGLDSEVFGWHIEQGIAHEVSHLSSFPPSRRDDLVVVHSSFGCPQITAFLLERRPRILLVHHNITPPELFFNVDPAFALGLASGRVELALIKPLVVKVIADSSFNARDINSLGYVDAEVIPPLLDPLRLARAVPDRAVRSLMAHGPGPTFVWISQLLAHKRPDVAVNAHHVLVSHFSPQARLFFVGAQRHPAFVEHLRRHVGRLRLPGVELVGRVTDEELMAYTEGADALIITSEHEGFCVPAVEAMALGVPVICRDAGAIPETVGDGALLLPRDAGPTDFAAAMDIVHRDAGARSELCNAGRRRAAHFALDRTEAAFLEALLPVL